VLAGSKDGPTDSCFARIGPGRPARRRPDGATGELVQAQGWVLTPLCSRPSGASPRPWDR